LPGAKASRTSPRPSLLERKHLLVRTAIWEAAMHLFAARGYDETTVDEIAEKAGISRRSFFRYFSSKGDLMGSALVEYGSMLSGVIQGRPRGSRISEVVRETVVRVARQSTLHASTRTVMQIVSRCPAAREALNSRAPELRQRVEAAFASRGADLGHLSAGILADLTLALLDVVFHHWFAQGEQDIGAAAEQVLNTLDRITC
jgi:AcrR family transcriptional regulator